MHKRKENFGHIQPNYSDFSNKHKQRLCGDLFTPGLEDLNSLHCAARNLNGGALSGLHPTALELSTVAVGLPEVTALNVIRNVPLR